MNIKQHVSSATFILPLDTAHATLELVGGKGASLARMAGAGLPVPTGFHITTLAYRHFVEQNDLQEKILAAVSGADPREPATLAESASQIATLFADGVMPDDIAEAIRQAYSELGAGDLAVAVRSSATAEDLPEMSFAGQQETFLNMRGMTTVLEAVKRCWASLWTARAIGYRAQHNIAPADVSLAVVVQELVAADAAGILFTANPLTGARDQEMINAAWGLGEAIVGGQVTPDTLVVAKTSGTIITQEIAAKQVMTIRTATGTTQEPVPAEKRTLAVLTPEQVVELAHIGTRIEQLYACPMDIEWVIKDGQVFVVQARPITALPTPTSSVRQTPEWKLPQAGGKYMRASVFELLPDPLSPLFATLGLPELSRALTDFLNKVPGMKGLMPDDTLTTINGYGYYNVSFSSAQTAQMLLLLPRLPFIYPGILRSAESRWQVAHARYTELTRRWEATNLTDLSSTSLLNGAREITTEAAQYYLSIQSGVLPAAYMSETIFTLLYDTFLKWHKGPTALTFVLGYDSAPIQAEKSLYDLARWARTRPELAPTLAHMTSSTFATAYQAEQVEGVDKEIWSEFRARFAAHLTKFGHAIYDLDFAKAVPIDNPSSLLETFKFFLSDAAPDPYKRQETTVAARDQAMHMALTRLHGVHLSLFRKLAGWAQRSAPLREDGLADVGLGWPVLRHMLHEIGRRLQNAGVIEIADDIFWLMLDDLRSAATALDAGQTLTDYHTIIAERRATWESERAATPPPSLPIKGGSRFLGMDVSRWLPARAEQQTGNTIKGIGASPGRITGTARVISGPDEFDQMRHGDILVAKITTPAWTPLFALAAGIVTDVGGPLSHSSIVAREYHIPAVLGTGVATERLHSGQQVTVDGTIGVVTISADQEP